jgi:Uma2 family endonuclease
VRATVTFVNESIQLCIPRWVTDLNSFRRWADGEDVPEKLRVWYLKGDIRIDLSREEVFTHVLLKGEFTVVLGGLVDAGQLGLFLADGVFLSNVEADLAGKPNATFVSDETRRAGRVRLMDNTGHGPDELQGSPDMVLEVVSDESFHWDTVTLRQAYWEAGVREYWLVDARRDPLAFDILRHTAKGFVATRKQGGWLKSVVFGKSFRLTQRVDEFGDPAFTLEVR